MANELAKAFNKTICKILKKWYPKIKALWAYWTTVRGPTQSAQFSLSYGVEVVLALEIQIPSLRMAVYEQLAPHQNAHIRLREMKSLDEHRLAAQQNINLY